ncbi:iron ABC transporter permease [Chlorobium sp. N1]|uniref:FecCD family ABC transporter permease n=1 Tax=Chlorobium sp. N1 TaxID=2491138 RepID=UPI00103ED9DE|nr:iron ABC transporter permease [Chlorobium sp. N1]TCD47210.1 iron ABC transporter permease [Chlorobium sp. N1]
MKTTAAVLGGLAVLLAAGLFSLFLGRYPAGVHDLLVFLLTGRYDDPNLPLVITGIRLPRLLAAMAVGGALALSGAAYQGMFRNPMVSPGILGVSSGAGFGAAMAILFSLPAAGVQLFSFAGGLAAVLSAVAISRSIRGGHDPLLVLVLSGIIISSFFGALLSILKYLADPDDKLPAIVYWLMGSLADVRMGDLAVVLPLVAVGAVPLLFSGWRLNVLSFGEDEARSLGVHTGRLRMLVILCATLVDASIISISGIIGWVGLVVPHIARFAVGPDHRRLLPVSFLFGAVFMVLVDNLARSMASVEVPVGIVTAIVGAPFFIVFLKRSQARPWQ